MALDPYAPCPCGSGKKLKFCCADLAGEIEKIQRMLEGDQPRAALAHIDKLIAKGQAGRSLIDMKASIEVAIGDLDAAEHTVEEQLRLDPQNPSAHAQAAIVAASVEEPYDPRGSLRADSPARRAVAHLQDALERVEDSIPARVLDAVGAVGQALLGSGDLVAARAHLWLYQGIAGDEDTRAMELLMRLSRVPELPLLLRDNLFLREAPAGHPVEAEHDHAQLLASRGQWRRAGKLLDELCVRRPDLPVLAYNAAVVAGWLGDQARFVAGLRTYARLLASQAPAGLPDDAVEAEAIAQLLDVDRGEDGVDVVRIDYAVADEETLIDRLTRDKRTALYRLSESELHALEGPPPRHNYLLLDRELPETGIGITAEVTPRIVAVLSYFGRQTSRPERLQIVCDRDERYDATLALLADIAGKGLGDKIDDEVTGQSMAGGVAIRTRWRFPDDTPVAERRSVMTAERRRVTLEDWPQQPLAKLGGKSPAEAAADPEQRLPLTAALMVLEQTLGPSLDPPTFDALREKLGLPASEPIDPRATDLEMIPLARVGRVDLAQASNEDLYSLYKRTELAGASEAARLVAREAVGRPDIAGDLPPMLLYERLAALEPDLDDALTWIERGRTASDDAGQSNAGWDLAELELRVVEGQFDEANRIVRHLSDNHLKEKGIAERLYELLYALGVMPSPERLAAQRGQYAEPEPALAGAPAGDTKLWTPGSDAPAAAGRSKLWTPD